MGDFLVWLSGASPRVLRRCPTERPKFVGIGSAILVTAGMAAVSMAFGLYNAVKAPLPVAILFALLWGLAILSLDRLFIVSMRRYRNWLWSLFLALPRVAMAVLLGFVISTPFVLQIFRPEINHQIAIIHGNEENAFADGLPRSPQYLAVKSDQQQVATYTADVRTGGSGIDMSADPTLQRLQKDLSTAQNNENYYSANLQCQETGKGNCAQGSGPLENNDRQEVSYWSGQVTSINRQIQNREQVLSNESSGVQQASKAGYANDLKQAKAKLARDQKTLNQYETQTPAAINADNGLLTQLSALSAATAGSAALWWARLLLFLVFLVIDTMPVLIKFLLNIAPESRYDVELTAEERRQARAAENARAALLSIERQADQAEVAMARDRISALRFPQPDVREEIIAARSRADRDWLGRWEEDQRRRAAGGGQYPDPDFAAATAGADWAAGHDGFAAHDGFHGGFTARNGATPPGGGFTAPGGFNPHDGFTTPEGSDGGRMPPPRSWGNQAPPTQAFDPRVPPQQPFGGQAPPRSSGGQAPPPRPWDQRQRGPLGWLGSGLLRGGRSSGRRPERWRQWPTNGV